MRIVLDTNILVRANPNVSPPGLPRDLFLTIVRANEHTLILSPAILVEGAATAEANRPQMRL